MRTGMHGKKEVSYAYGDAKKRGAEVRRRAGRQESGEEARKGAADEEGARKKKKKSFEG